MILNSFCRAKNGGFIFTVAAFDRIILLTLNSQHLRVLRKISVHATLSDNLVISLTGLRKSKGLTFFFRHRKLISRHEWKSGAKERRGASCKWHDHQSNGIIKEFCRPPEREPKIESEVNSPHEKISHFYDVPEKIFVPSYTALSVKRGSLAEGCTNVRSMLKS